MRNTYNRRENSHFGSRRNSSFRSGYKPQASRFPQKKRTSSSMWSEFDLVQSIEYSKAAPKSSEDTDYTPQNSFEDFSIDPQLKANIGHKGFTKPSPIQDSAIPHILEGRDIIGIANTGTGKTAAFLVPLINKVFKDKTQRVLIVAPTRELAEQIVADFRSLSFRMNMKSATIIGGGNMRRQIDDIYQNPSFVIGTPGRLRDLITRNVLNLSTFNNVVLDETDRMVDIGFIKEIEYFISLLPKNRQSLFFSATISPKVQQILNAFVKNPITVSVKTRETCENIHQDIIRVPRNERKVETLHNLLIKQDFNKVIVFGNSKWGIQKLADELVSRGFKADAIHGDKRQNQRRQTLEKFKKNEIKVLLATDVAARGLDISDVTHVINYELPKTYDDYVHRIGRTGRANKTGVALTFVNSN